MEQLAVGQVVVQRLHDARHAGILALLPGELDAPELEQLVRAEDVRLPVLLERFAKLGQPRGAERAPERRVLGRAHAQLEAPEAAPPDKRGN